LGRGDIREKRDTTSEEKFSPGGAVLFLDKGRALSQKGKIENSDELQAHISDERGGR